MQRDREKFTAPDLVNSECTECGATVPPEYASCDAFFLSILFRWYEGGHSYRLLRLVVDTFGMQHPKRSCKSAKSYAAHLAGLCCGLEFNASESIYAAIQRWLDGPVENIGITRPQEPEYRGALTIRQLYDAESENAFVARALEWAQDVWEACSSQHELARGWIGQAMDPGRQQRG